MILPVAVARGVAEGDVDRVYRRWARSRIVAGSTLRTAAGVVEVVAVEEVDPAAITDDDARAAGEQSADRVRRAFRGAPSDPVFRIRLRFAGTDPRESLRGATGDLDEVVATLDRMDRRSRRGPGPGRRCGWSPSCPGSGPPSSRSGPDGTPSPSSATSGRSRSWA